MGAQFGVSLQFPGPALDPGRPRATFRDMANNAMRGPMRRAVADLRDRSYYQKIADRYLLEQRTEGDLTSYAIYNTALAARWLIGGTQAHRIEMPPHSAPLWKLLLWAQHMGLTPAQAYTAWRRIRQGGQVMLHPGIKPDMSAQNILAGVEAEILSRVPAIYERWAAGMGQEVPASDGGAWRCQAPPLPISSTLW